MSDLMKVTDKNGQSVISARELHEFLEVKSKLFDWFKNQSERAMLIEHEDYERVSIILYTPGGVQNGTDFALSISAAKEIAMLNGGEKGKQARQYFIECEKKLKAALPSTYKEALLALIAKEEEKERLALQVDNLEIALDCYLDWASILKVAKHNKVKENVFDWRKLKKASEEMGFEIKKAASPRFEYQNLYHVNVFRRCYPSYNYDIKDI